MLPLCYSKKRLLSVLTILCVVWLRCRTESKLGRDINVTLTVSNVGDVAATEVVLSDKVRGPQFSITAGDPVTKFDSIAP